MIFRDTNVVTKEMAKGKIVVPIYSGWFLAEEDSQDLKDYLVRTFCPADHLSVVELGHRTVSFAPWSPSLLEWLQDEGPTSTTARLVSFHEGDAISAILLEDGGHITAMRTPDTPPVLANGVVVDVPGQEISDRRVDLHRGLYGMTFDTMAELDTYVTSLKGTPRQPSPEVLQKFLDYVDRA